MHNNFQLSKFLSPNCLSFRNMRKVYICGAHSTGKTTLLNYLQENLIIETGNVLYSEEIARKVMQENKIDAKSQEDAEVFKALSFLILEKQCEREIQMKNLLEERDNKLCIYDRGVLDPICYLHMTQSKEFADSTLKEDHIFAQVKSMQNHRETLVFILKPYLKYITFDNVRTETFSFEDILQYVEVMKSLMKSLNIKFYFIECDDLKDRAQFIFKEVTKQWPELHISLK